MKKLPIFLAAVNGLFTSLVFGATIVLPNAQLLPGVLVAVDYPFSVLINLVCVQFHSRLEPNYSWIADFVVYLILGSAWFYAIGFVIRGIFNRFTAGKELTAS